MMPIKGLLLMPMVTWEWKEDPNNFEGYFQRFEIKFE